LDDLSSGEKSIIQMFFPLVERGIRTLLRGVAGPKEESVRPEHCFLIDEPELHLHPNLQLKVLDYFRVLASSEHTQVMLATHSPTMVESASFEELFILRPVELVAPDENQLVRVATDDERLRALRDLFGGTSNLTSLQPIVVVEGVREGVAKKVASDRKLYRALHPGFDHVTIIPGGGKAECRLLLKGMREVLLGFSTHLNAVALLDRDYANAPDEEGIFQLPVAMIENFLLDPDVLWQAIQSVAETAGFASPQELTTALTATLDGSENEEVERRALAALGTVFFRPARPMSEVAIGARTFVDETLARFSNEAVEAAMTTARVQVAAVRGETRRREDFHGKEILRKFYGAHLHKTALSKVVFTFEAARYARQRKSIARFFDKFFSTVVPAWAAQQAVAADGAAPRR
jgi:hypothetical protein